MKFVALIFLLALPAAAIADPLPDEPSKDASPDELTKQTRPAKQEEIQSTQLTKQLEQLELLKQHLKNKAAAAAQNHKEKKEAKFKGTPPASLVQVDDQEDQKRVGVLLPHIVDMIHEYDKEDHRSQLDLTVLSGLVKVDVDKTISGDKKSGPVSVSVFGIPVYVGNTVSQLSEHKLKHLARKNKLRRPSDQKSTDSQVEQEQQRQEQEHDQQ